MLQFARLATVVCGCLPGATEFPHQHSLEYSVPANAYPFETQKSIHFPSVILSSPKRLPVRVRPGPSVALVSSGAQPTKAKRLAVMSVYGRELVLGVEVLVLLALLL